MMDRLEMLTAREQLMEDIDAIIEGFYFDNPSEFARGDDRLQLTATDSDELTRILCDAVCKNFPTNWYKLIKLMVKMNVTLMTDLNDHVWHMF